MQRDGFRRITVDLLEAAPEVDDLKAFAKRNPDKWIRATSIAAQLAGFQQDSVAQTNVLVINQLPDSTLQDRMHAAEQRLRELQQSKALEHAVAHEPLPQRSIEQDQNIVDVIVHEIDEHQTTASSVPSDGTVVADAIDFPQAPGGG